MDLQTQKLSLIEEVLHLESSEQLHQLSDFLRMLKEQPADLGLAELDDLPVMPARSAEEIRARYEQSLRELKEGQGYSHEEVVALTQQWRDREPV